MARAYGGIIVGMLGRNFSPRVCGVKGDDLRWRGDDGKGEMRAVYILIMECGYASVKNGGKSEHSAGCISVLATLTGWSNVSP